MTPVTIDLPNHTRGDTWEGLSIGPVLFNGAAPPEALQSCRLYFRTYKKQILGYGFKSVVTSGYGLISITDPAAWIAQIAPQSLPLDVGLWLWDFETIDAAGTVVTIYAGKLNITPDVSYD